MKKLLIPILSLGVLFACQKEKSAEQQTAKLPVKKSSLDPDHYEQYDFPSNYENVLIGHLENIEEGNSVGDRPVPEALWIMEAGLNLVSAHPLWEFDGISTSTQSVTLSLNGQDELPGQTLTDEFLSLYSSIEGEIPTDHEILTTDISVTAHSTGEQITLEVATVFAQNPSTITTSTGVYGGLPAVDDREAGTDQYCGSKSGSTGDGPTYQYNADQAMAGYNRGFAFKWGSGSNKGFNMNVVNWRSTNPTGQNKLSKESLFGNASSVVASYDTPQPETTCLSESEQDDYIDIMWDETSNLAFNSQYKVTSIKVNRIKDQFNNNYIFWYYENVRVGEWRYALDQNFTFSP